MARAAKTPAQSVGMITMGLGLLFNWNLLGDGAHTVKAFADNQEFANATVTVTTLGEEFLTGASGEFTLSNFPQADKNVTLLWQQSLQNFVLKSATGSSGGNSGVAPHILENPQPGSFQSGIGVISGWVCDAQRIDIEFDGVRYPGRLWHEPRRHPLSMWG